MMTSAASDEPFYDHDLVITGVLGMPPIQIPTFEPPTLTPLRTPLSDATVGILTTSGAYYPDQPRLQPTNDLSFRLLPRGRSVDELLIAHTTPVRAFAVADPNVAYPLDTLLALEGDGSIGRLADSAVSMVGSVSLYDELATVTAPRIVDEMSSIGVDLLLVLPFCPQCHVAAAVLARAIEARGVPTTSIATLYKQVSALKPPRANFLDFPLGCPCGRPKMVDQQKRIVRDALAWAYAASDEWAINRLPFQWESSDDRSWESLVSDLYRVDNAISARVAGNRAVHSDDLVGRERDFTIRCAC